MELEKRKKYMIEAIENDYLGEEQLKLLHDIMNIKEYMNMKEVLTMSGYDVSQTFDTAYPSPYADKIREIYPEFNNGWHMYDYSKKSFGEMVNVYNLFAKNILKTMAGWKKKK